MTDEGSEGRVTRRVRHTQPHRRRRGSLLLVLVTVRVGQLGVVVGQVMGTEGHLDRLTLTRAWVREWKRRLGQGYVHMEEIGVNI